jgi:hypothetical protein
MALVASAALLCDLGSVLLPGGWSWRHDPPAPFVAGSDPGFVAFDAEVGVTGIAGIARIDASRPFTLVAVRPRRRDSSIEVLAVRAIFYGVGPTSRGYRMVNGYPLVTCTRSAPTGYGPSYPVEGLELGAGDVAHLVFYVRSDSAGAPSLAGADIDYRDSGGRLRTVSAATLTFTMHLHRPGEEPVPDHTIVPCSPDIPKSWASPAPGFPG